MWFSEFHLKKSTVKLVDGTNVHKTRPSAGVDLRNCPHLAQRVSSKSNWPKFVRPVKRAEPEGRGVWVGLPPSPSQFFFNF